MSRSTDHPIDIGWALRAAMVGPVSHDGERWIIGGASTVTDNGDGSVTVAHNGTQTRVIVAGRRCWEYLEAFEVLLRPARDRVRQTPRA